MLKQCDQCAIVSESPIDWHSNCLGSHLERLGHRPAPDFSVLAGASLLCWERRSFFVRAVILHLPPPVLLKLLKLPVNHGRSVTWINVFTDSSERWMYSLSRLRNRAKLYWYNLQLLHTEEIVRPSKTTANTIESDLFQADSL
jgi:hypothetical protein